MTLKGLGEADGIVAGRLSSTSVYNGLWSTPSPGEDVDLVLLHEGTRPHGVATHQQPKGVLHLVDKVFPGGSAAVLLQVV